MVKRETWLRRKQGNREKWETGKRGERGKHGEEGNMVKREMGTRGKRSIEANVTKDIKMGKRVTGLKRDS